MSTLVGNIDIAKSFPQFTRSAILAPDGLTGKQNIRTWFAVGIGRGLARRKVIPYCNIEPTVKKVED